MHGKPWDRNCVNAVALKDTGEGGGIIQQKDSDGKILRVEREIQNLLAHLRHGTVSC